MTTLALPAVNPPPLRGLALLAPALMVTLVVLPVHYSVTLAEPDLARMMAALVYGGMSGLELDPVTHYGAAFSFGYYQLFYALAPHEWLRHPDLVARLMNGFGVFSGILCACTCAAYLERLYGLRAALAATTAFFLSPVMLPLAFSGHPLVPAAACLFAGSTLLLSRRWLPALVLLSLALSFRAEVLLAFPFIALADANGMPRVWQAALRALVLAAAFLVFLAFQHHYIGEHGGGGLAKLRDFAHSYLNALHVGRGAGVLVLATGLASAALGLLAFVKLRAWQDRALILLLAAPALVFWLPNPTAARHFFFPVLAACLALGLYAERSARTTLPRTLLLAVLIVAVNQAIAELVRPLIVARYPWSYDLPVARRAAQRFPIGAFSLDQRANQAFASLEREEAMQLARQAPRRLLVLAGSDEYFIAQLLAHDPQLRWTESVWNGIYVTELAGGQRSIVIVDKASGWPRDVNGEALARPEWRELPVYEQRTTVSRYDRTPVPPVRRFELR